MEIFKEFKAFAMRGNVVDMAVGIVVGAAFGKIANSFVSDVFMPPLGIILGKVDFSDLFFDLSGTSHPTLAAAKAAGAATINYGMFINTIVQFLIVSFAMFMLIRQINKLEKKPEPTPTSKPCPLCFSNIPIKAIRCPNCTSDLREQQAA